MASLPKTMKAVGLYKYLPISEITSLLDLEVSLPILKKNEVLINVKAVGVNPIDTKIRAPKATIETVPKILGWDGSGVVVSTNEDAKLHKIGDEVFFSGDIAKNGANAEYFAVHEFSVGPKPKKLSFEEAAAMPLTSITAYETLYDRMGISSADKGKALLIINSAGGVGSIASQLAKYWGLHVIGTASRDETKEWSKLNGADFVIDHRKDLVDQLKEVGHENVDYILVNYDPAPHWDTVINCVKPQGKIGLLAESSKPVDITTLRDKSITLVSETIRTRIKYKTKDRYRHHEILQEVSKLLDEGKLKTTLKIVLSPINSANLRDAHKLMEEKKMVGKLVVSGF